MTAQTQINAPHSALSTVSLLQTLAVPLSGADTPLKSRALRLADKIAAGDTSARTLDAAATCTAELCDIDDETNDPELLTRDWDEWTA